MLLPRIDRSIVPIKSRNRATGAYLDGVPPTPETQFVAALKKHWRICNPDLVDCEIAYGSGVRGKCDLIIKNSDSEDIEWAIEIKRIQFVGDNGKGNDFALPKTLSPYLKDRSMIHDVYKLRDGFDSDRKAVIAYGFEYSFQTCHHAYIRHPNYSDRIDNLRHVCALNDPIHGIYDLEPLIQMLDNYLQSEKLVKRKYQTDFMNAWTHPCGGSGKVFGWELSKN
jgi:hypothetical protein